jgi:hypothetical protein
VTVQQGLDAFFITCGIIIALTASFVLVVACVTVLSFLAPLFSPRMTKPTTTSEDDER